MEIEETYEKLKKQLETLKDELQSNDCSTASIYELLDKINKGADSMMDFIDNRDGAYAEDVMEVVKEFRHNYGREKISSQEFLNVLLERKLVLETYYDLKCVIFELNNDTFEIEEPTREQYKNYRNQIKS